MRRHGALVLMAGPDAARIIRERGLRAEDVDIVPGASGGPKWLALAALDRHLFGEFLQQPRERPLHLIGSSIGSWRLACLAQRDPVGALARGHGAYIEQRYDSRPSAVHVTGVISAILDEMLGDAAEEEILSHPWARLHIITAEFRGLGASDRRAPLLASLALSAAGNLISRRLLSVQMRRVIFHACGDASPFRRLADLPTVHLELRRENLRAALLASAAVPLVLTGVRIPGVDGTVHRDGGIIDYHLDLDFGTGDGLVLYPHFFPRVVPGWFDRSLRWRTYTPGNFRRVLLLAPSPEYVARLPHGRIPDRKDFYRLDTDVRIRAWRTAVAESERLADEFRELVASGHVADVLQPL